MRVVGVLHDCHGEVGVAGASSGKFTFVPEIFAAQLASEDDRAAVEELFG